jgi:hypothetical protein
MNRLASVRPMRAAALLSTLALSALVLAGCSDKPDAVAPAPPPVALPAPRFEEPVPMPQVGGGEPNIAILPDGTLFVASPAGLSKPNAQQGGAWLWRSRDGGHQWETLRQPYAAEQQEQQGLPAGAFCSCDADVVASPDGWVYYADWWIAGLAGPGQYIVEASSDGGETWTANGATIPENVVASVDREWLVAGADGFLGLFYSFYGSTPLASPPVPAFGLDRPGQAIEAVFSMDHGQTWSTPAPVVPAGAGDLQIGHPFLAPNGTLMMAYGLVHTTSTGGFWLDDSEVRLAYSEDQGATWKDTLLASAPLGFDNLWAVQGTVDASTGEATVVWAARDTGVSRGKVSSDSSMGLWVKQFGPLGDREPSLVRGVGQNFLPWATARDGAAAVGWYGGDATGDMTQAKSGSEWFAYVATAPDGIFRAGNVAVAQVSAEPVKSGAICPKGAACNGDRELLDYVSLVLDGQGLLHYTYTKSESGNPHVHVAGQRTA